MQQQGATMKFSSPLFHWRSIKGLIVSGLSTAVLASCAAGSTIPQLSDAEICKTIQYIISQADDDFKAIRIRKTIHPSVDIWESKKIFPDSRKCQIWSWSQGLTNYACMWEEKDEADARDTYAKYRPVVSACLGDKWEAIERTSKNGKQTLFRKADDKTTVSMRYFQDRRSLLRSWWTSFIIGPEIKTYDPLERYNSE